MPSYEYVNYRPLNKKRRYVTSSLLLFVFHGVVWSWSIVPNTRDRSRVVSRFARARDSDAAASLLEQAKAINTELIQATTAQQVLAYFVAKGGARGVAGGGIFNSVNYSTCLHRLARFATTTTTSSPSSSSSSSSGYLSTAVSRESDLHPEKIRRNILTDPRFAILAASLCEALAGLTPSSNAIDELDPLSLSPSSSPSPMIFCSRELSNIAWAIAKLKLAPPADIWPILRPNTSRSNTDTTTDTRIRYSTIPEIKQDLISTSKWVRQQVLQVAKQRSQSEFAVSSHPWIPTLSQLSGKLLDTIAMYVLDLVDSFKPQELANMLWAFSTADRADPQFFETLTDRLVSCMEETQGESSKTIKVSKTSGTAVHRIKPQELSNSIWAIASAGIRGKNQLRLILFTADTLDENNGQILDSFKPQELSNTAWGISTLISKRENNFDNIPNEEVNTMEDAAAIRIFRCIAKTILSRADEFKPQELSNTVWSWATCGFGCLSDSNESIMLRAAQTEADRILVIQALEAVAKSASRRLHKFRPQELNNLAWGFARLGYYDNTVMKLFEGIGKELIKRHSYFAPQDIGTTLWSCATVEYFEPDVFKAAASELTLRTARFFKPQEMSNTVWSLATAGILPKYVNVFDTTLVPAKKRVSLSEIVDDPITECFAAAAAELIRRPQDFKEQEIKDVLWSLSKAGIRHPLAFRRVAEHLVGTDDEASQGFSSRGLSRFSPQGLGNLAWSYAKQAQLAEAVQESVIGSSGRLAVYETTFLDVGETLINRLFTNIATSALHSDGGLSRFKPQDLSNTCWSFSTLGMLHAGFFTAVALQVHERLAAWNANKQFNNAMVRFKSQEIANLAWSYATLNFSPKGMMTAFAPYILAMCSNSDGYGNYDLLSISKYFKLRQEAANLSWSCCVLREYPPKLMPLLYTALIGNGNAPLELNKVYGDDGLQKQAIMTLFYVQMALDIEAPELQLRLPEKFPAGWWENSKKVYNRFLEDKRDTSSMLELTTSRLQNDVSRALNRVGFEHVQEHLIVTDDLDANYGIKLSTERLEFLSIDIARLEDRTGVEVDGPAHFVNILDQGRRQPNGPTALKERLLSHLGWKIIHVPFWEWREVDGDKKREEEYCIDRILVM